MEADRCGYPDVPNRDAAWRKPEEEELEDDESGISGESGGSCTVGEAALDGLIWSSTFGLATAGRCVERVDCVRVGNFCA